MISRRTASSDSVGHNATSVGTVETTVTSLATSHGPTSTPLRTSDRGAGTRQPPCAQASHISSHEASKATERPAITRSVGPSGSPWRNIRDSASTNAAADRCETATPFGVPVEPDVKMIHASSPGPGSASSRGPPRPPNGPVGDDEAVADHSSDGGLPEDEPRALVGIVRVDRDVGGPGGEHAHDRDVQVDGAGPDPDAHPISPTDADGVQRRGEHVSRLGELLVGEHLGAVVDRQGVGMVGDGLPEDVDQGPR